MRVWRALLSLLLVGMAGCKFRQKQPSAWPGEWGRFVSMNGPKFSPWDVQGAGLSIYDCRGQQCSIHVVVRDKGGHGEADGIVEIQSPSEAIARLSSEGQEPCSLHLTKQADVITAVTGAGDCSYFVTPGASFLHTYPLQTAKRYFGSDVAECFAALNPSKKAICESRELSRQSGAWELLFEEVDDLRDPRDASSAMPSETERQQAAEGQLLGGCERSPEVESCLRSAFAQSAANLQARKAAWQQSVHETGDPTMAAQLAAAIAGHYRHTFANGDVQGNHLRSTDHLAIVRLPNDAIHYDVRLNFFNGHECQIDGEATYRKAGFFVDEKKAVDPQDPRCFFEVLPGKAGVQLGDPMGGCKMLSCGERGGYHGATFPFSERRICGNGSSTGPSAPRVGLGDCGRGAR